MTAPARKEDMNDIEEGEEEMGEVCLHTGWETVSIPNSESEEEEEEDEEEQETQVQQQEEQQQQQEDGEQHIDHHYHHYHYVNHYHHHLHYDQHLRHHYWVRQEQQQQQQPHIFDFVWPSPSPPAAVDVIYDDQQAAKKSSAWYPGLEDGVPEEWREGDEPHPFEGEEEEPEIPDPNMEGMPTIWGYEDCDFDKKKKARPPLEHHHGSCEPHPVEVKSVPVPEEDVCRRVVTEHVQSDCCLGKEPINTMVINSVKPSNALTYSLESFVEKRKVGYEYKPYKGGEIDDPSKGRAPECWDMKVKFKEYFKDESEKDEVPHTSSVRTCHYCCGRGFVRCRVCRGWGRHVCRHCSGLTSMAVGEEGAEGMAMCSSCNDTHFEACERCGADGRIVCPACEGYRAIRCFIQLKTKFKTYKEEYVKEDTALPDHLIKEVKGVTVFEQTHDKLFPLMEFSDAEIASKSQQFFSKHNLELLDKKRLLQQRQKLVAVPVAEVEVTWKEQPGRFWVYGKENKLYLADYPDTCACCAIL